MTDEVKPNSDISEMIHCTSVVVDATARNSASVEDRASVGWRFELHAIGFDPR